MPGIVTPPQRLRDPLGYQRSRRVASGWIPAHQPAVSNASPRGAFGERVGPPKPTDRIRLSPQLRGELSPQQVASMVQPPFHGGDRNREMGRDPAEWPLLVVVQPQDPLVVRRQPRQRRADAREVIGTGALIGRIHGPFTAVGEEAVEGGHVGRLAATLACPNAPGSTAGDHEEPVGKPGRVAELRQRVQRLQKGILDHNKSAASSATWRVVSAFGIMELAVFPSAERGTAEMLEVESDGKRSS